jgi:hypothetical protein
MLCNILVLFFNTCLGLKQGETQDFLFIATERYKFCVLQWDTEKSELFTRYASQNTSLISVVGLYWYSQLW